MLTQHQVRQQLDSIADEVAQPAGLYYELYTRLFSQRVHCWIRTASHTEAALIQRVAETDPDYLVDMETMAPFQLAHTEATQQPLINPAWDMDY